MKVISLLQPWASLVVLGAKKIETRSWNTHFRGDILIHASKRMDTEQKKLTHSEPFWPNLQHLEELPLGSIIGKVNLVHTFISELTYSGEGMYYQQWSAKFTKEEMAFGDYSPGRWGWMLAEPAQFKKPIPYKGARGLWDFEERLCLQCGCHELDACMHSTLGNCWWSGPNLCSHCFMINNKTIEASEVRRYGL